MTNSADRNANVIRRLWNWFWGPAKIKSLGVLLIVAAFGGILFWGGFNWAMELSNTETFCVSCHEMRDSPFKELKETVHYSNKSGVRATCPDCHVPKEWIHKVVRKAQATINELPKHLVGTLDSPEKFEVQRLHLAMNVWSDMKDTDSRECRNCHDTESMNLDDQLRPARKKHIKASEAGLTCIECHQGIAHKLPEDWKGAWKAKWGD